MTYEIQNVDNLETTTADLASTNQQVSIDVAELVTILNDIKTHWQNEAGSDLASIISALEDCIRKVQSAINPTVGQYVDTMNGLVALTRQTERETI